MANPLNLAKISQLITKLSIPSYSLTDFGITLQVRYYGIMSTAKKVFAYLQRFKTFHGVNVRNLIFTFPYHEFSDEDISNYCTFKN